jgi:hypothetical protein
VAPPVIISASRRTDIPAFFPEWFASCVSAGRAEYRNPYSGKPAAVSLRKEDVAAFVFWTRNPSPFLPALDRLEREGFRSLFQFTLTGFPPELEPSVPAFEEAVSAFRRLSETIGPGRVLWRFDPLFPGEPPDALVARFDRVSSSLSGLTTRCTVSIAHPYRKSLRTTRNLREIWEPSDRFREAVLSAAAIGRARGFDLRSCCAPPLVEWGIPPAGCVDGDWIKNLWPDAEIPVSPSPVRPGCLCSASRDIGSYRTCRHGCVYCYAA